MKIATAAVNCEKTKQKQRLVICIYEVGKMKITQIVSDILDSNTFVCETDNGCFIFDCGASLEKVMSAVKGKVLAIFLTHGHYDHAKHALEYSKTFGCKIYANKNVTEILPDPAKNYGENFAIDDFSDFVLLDGDGQLSIGGQKIEYFHCPGHSKCCCCYLLNNHLFAGDVLFFQGIGRTDLYGGSKLEMLSSLKKLENVDFEIAHSGHDRDSTRLEQNKNIKVFERFLSR